MLLERGANINTQNKEGLTPLQQASQSTREGYLDIMRFLLDHGANGDSRDDHGNTALHFAASKGHLEVARMLLERGANIDSQNDEGLTPLQQASQVMWERHLCISLLLDHGANVNARDNHGNTALHFAASGGPPNTARILLERGANVNSQNNKGLTPLHQASQSMREGYLDIMHFLLDHGANWNSRDNHGNTALHFVASKGRLEAARILLERGADVDSQNDVGLTPLQRASQGQGGLLNIDPVRLLGHKPGTDVDFQSDQIRLRRLLPGMSRIGEGYLCIMRLLLANGANVNVHDDNGNTALHFVASECCLKAARILLERNAEVDYRNSRGSTSLLVASEHGTPDLVQLFLDYKADVHACDADGGTVLHRAAIAGRLETCRLLLKLDVEVNSRNNEGLTPLHLASAGYEKGNLNLVRLLLDHGADAQARNLSGKIASEVARGRSRDEIVQLLSQHTAE